MPLCMMNCNGFTPLAVRHGPHRYRLTGLIASVRKYLQVWTCKYAQAAGQRRSCVYEAA
jgi:lysylphosphatidylglycerol synthetase-like protein (DUF2156 family)